MSEKTGVFVRMMNKKQIKKIWKLGSHGSFPFSITSYVLHILLCRAIINSQKD